jgi:hypothetical protein
MTGRKALEWEVRRARQYNIYRCERHGAPIVQLLLATAVGLALLGFVVYRLVSRWWL